MKTFALILAAIVYLSTGAHAQNKTYFGIEFSVGNDLWEIDDQGGYLVTVPLIDAQGSIHLRQEVNRNIFVEAGVLLKQYWQGFGFKTIPYYGATTSDPSWLLPVRIGVNVNVYKKKIYLVPVVGYTHGINSPYGPFPSSPGYGTQRSSTIVVNYDYTEYPRSWRHFSLLQRGIGLEVKVFRGSVVSLCYNHYHGLDRVVELAIRYDVNNSPPMTGTAISKGEFWNVALGLKYPISNFWQRKLKA